MLGALALTSVTDVYCSDVPMPPSWPVDWGGGLKGKIYGSSRPKMRKDGKNIIESGYMFPNFSENKTVFFPNKEPVVVSIEEKKVEFLFSWNDCFKNQQPSKLRRSIIFDRIKEIVEIMKDKDFSDLKNFAKLVSDITKRNELYLAFIVPVMAGSMQIFTYNECVARKKSDGSFFIEKKPWPPEIGS
jgi:hypothetical protein